MKLLFLIGSLQGGGAEHVLTTVCNNLASRGHEIILVYDFHFKDYVVNNNVREIDTNTFEADTSKGGIFRRYYNKLANRFRDYSFFQKLIREEKPDVATVFLTNWSWQLSLICKGRVPLVFSERNTFDWNYKSFNHWINKAFYYHMGDMVTVMTYYDKAFLRNRYKNVTVFHNPLSYQPLSEDEYRKTFKERKHILACGRLVADKGFDKLIAAFSQIANKYPDWHVNIAGQDMQHSNYSQHLRNLVAETDLEERIHFIGFHRNMDEIMKQHSVFCLCSQHEGFPNVLSEAMSMGCACVSFDIVTGPREIIIDRLDGLIVNNQDIDSLAEGLSSVMSNEDIRYNFGLRAIENIKRFSPAIVIDQWEEMYNNILKSQKQ